MTLRLHDIKPKAGSTRARKRIGRGNAAGQGTYSGRGLKGQKSRKGVSGLKRLGMRQVLLRTPKKRGFRSDKPKALAVNVAALNIHFKDKEIVSPKTLLEKGLIDVLGQPIKILGQGELKVKGLKFEGVKMSASAKAQIEKLA